MSKEQTRNRLQLSLTVPMRLALEVLSEEHGSYPSAEATRLLRAALERTMQTAEVQRRWSAHKAQRTRNEWVYDQTSSRAIDEPFERDAKATAPTRD